MAKKIGLPKGLSPGMLVVLAGGGFVLFLVAGRRSTSTTDANVTMASIAAQQAYTAQQASLQLGLAQIGAHSADVAAEAAALPGLASALAQSKQYDAAKQAAAVEAVGTAAGGAQTAATSLAVSGLSAYSSVMQTKYATALGAIASNDEVRKVQAEADAAVKVADIQGGVTEYLAPYYVQINETNARYGYLTQQTISTNYADVARAQAQSAYLSAKQTAKASQSSSNTASWLGLAGTVVGGVLGGPVGAGIGAAIGGAASK